MLSQVTHQVKRRPTGQKLLKSRKQHWYHQRQRVAPVDIAPELLRWSDFLTPFPSVTPGGYTRYYATHTMPEPMELPNFCPSLSLHPEPLPSSETPHAPLFSTLKRRRCPPVIDEVSPESLTPHTPVSLNITTEATPPHPLKRRRKRIFNPTPITENNIVYQPLSTSITTIQVGDDTSSTTIPSSPRSTYSTDSVVSHEGSDSNHSEFLITPSTSIEGNETDDEGFPRELLDKLSPPSDSGSVMTRPISFSSARSVFSEI